MTNEYAFFDQDEGIVSVFVSSQSLSGDLSDYFEEQYEDDYAPLSRFAADVGLKSYDHDGLEVAFRDTIVFPAGKAEELFTYEDYPMANSYMEQFGEKLVSDLKSLNIAAGFAALLYGYDYRKNSHYQNGKRAKHVVFVGAYEYQP